MISALSCLFVNKTHKTSLTPAQNTRHLTRVFRLASARLRPPFFARHNSKEFLGHVLNQDAAFTAEQIDTVVPAAQASVKNALASLGNPVGRLRHMRALMADLVRQLAEKSEAVDVEGACRLQEAATVAAAAAAARVKKVATLESVAGERATAGMAAAIATGASARATAANDKRDVLTVPAEGAGKAAAAPTPGATRAAAARSGTAGAVSLTAKECTTSAVVNSAVLSADVPTAAAAVATAGTTTAAAPAAAPVLELEPLLATTDGSHVAKRCSVNGLVEGTRVASSDVTAGATTKCTMAHHEPWQRSEQKRRDAAGDREEGGCLGSVPAHGETPLLMLDRWRELHDELYDEVTGFFDITKVRARCY